MRLVSKISFHLQIAMFGAWAENEYNNHKCKNHSMIYLHVCIDLRALHTASRAGLRDTRTNQAGPSECSFTLGTEPSRTDFHFLNFFLKFLLKFLYCSD